MTVHTDNYPLLQCFIAFITTAWAPRVDFDPTLVEEEEVVYV